MKKLLLAAVAAAFGSALILGSAFAHGPGPTHPGAGRTMGMHATGTAKLWILHVAKGCHSWTDGKRMAETVRLTINPGGRLVVVNQDIDGHKLVQTAGPRVAVGRPMAMNHGTTIVFRKPGLYKFKTRTFEMPGMAEVHTVGPDHELTLIVRAET